MNSGRNDTSFSKRKIFGNFFLSKERFIFLFVYLITMEDFDAKTTLKRLIAEFHSKGIPEAFERDIAIPELKKINKIFVIIGPRRAGKTYFLFNSMKRLIEKGNKLADILYINFENERISEIKLKQLNLIIEAFMELYPGKTPILFFDEIQNIDGWEKFVRRLNDSGYRIYISGSNSKLLGKEIATALRGRCYPISVMPLSFKEFLRVRNVELALNWEFTDRRHLVKKLFGEYLSSSGFPEVVIGQKLEFVDEYFKTMLYRDAVERYKITNAGLLRTLMKYLTRNYSQEYSINKFNNFAKSTGYKSSTSVVHKYSRILEDIFFCFLVKARQKSFKKESSYVKKSYLADHGFINYYNSESDIGRLLENVVYIELVRRGMEAHYYKNGFECDFVTQTQCIQVCHTLTNENKEREINGLNEAVGRFNIKTARILTYDQESELNEGAKIKVIPIWKWLLETPE